jgi:hypothetical protein
MKIRFFDPKTGFKNGSSKPISRSVPKTGSKKWFRIACPESPAWKQE